jgi:hypothetical protein
MKCCAGNDEVARQGKLEDWMKPGLAVPGAAWGKALNGLRAAVVFSTTEPKLRQQIKSACGCWSWTRTSWHSATTTA